jgi:hypothetical protein
MSEVLTLGPVTDFYFLHLFLVWNMTVESTLVTNDGRIRGSKNKLLGRDGYTDILQSLQNVVNDE